MTRWIIFVLILALTLCSLVACTPATEGLPEGKKVAKIGLICPFTGAAASATYPILLFTQDYIRYFNEEQGIPGVTVELLWRDTAHQVANAISAFHSFIEDGAVLIISVDDKDATAFKPLCAKNEVPMFAYAGLQHLLDDPGWAYWVYATEAERFTVLCDWIMENWKEERPPRLAFIGPDVSRTRETELYGTEYASSIGMEVLPAEIVSYVPLDTTPQLLRLSVQGVDFVYICGVWVTAPPVLKDAERLELNDRMQFGGFENTQSLGMLGAVGPTAEGYFAPRVGPWIEETDVPGIKLLRDLQMKYRGKLNVQGDEGAAVRVPMVACEALRIAIENVGYDNLDGRAVKEALDSIKDFDTYGLGAITYTPENHRGFTKARIYQVKDGKVVPVTDWRDTPIIIAGE